MSQNNFISDLDFIKSLPDAVEFNLSHWHKLKDELSTFISRQEDDGSVTFPLKDMYDYFLNTTDISPKFATTAILYLLGSATTREQVIEYHQGSQNLNIWTIVIGQSSIMRKTTTQNKIIKILKDAQIPIVDAKFTAAALIDVLEKNPQCSMVISEFSGMLKSFKNDFYSDLPEALCDIYDCKDEVVKWTRSKGRESVKNPYVNFWTSTTVESYNLFTEDLFTQGFMFRFLYCIEDTKDRYDPLSFAPKYTDYSQIKSTEILQGIRSSPIEIIRPSSVTGPWANYQKYCDTIIQNTQNSVFSTLFSYYGRVPEYTLKIAGLLELARMSYIGVPPMMDGSKAYIGLTDQALNLAVKIMRMYEYEFRKLVEKTRIVAESEPVRTEDKDRTHLIRSMQHLDGVASKGELVEITKFSPFKIGTLLTGLIMTRRILPAKLPHPSGRGRPSLIYYVYDGTQKEDEVIKEYQTRKSFLTK